MCSITHRGHIIQYAARILYITIGNSCRRLRLNWRFLIFDFVHFFFLKFKVHVGRVSLCLFLRNSLSNVTFLEWGTEKNYYRQLNCFIFISKRWFTVTVRTAALHGCLKILFLFKIGLLNYCFIAITSLKKKIELLVNSCRFSFVWCRRGTGSTRQCTGQFLWIHLRSSAGFERLFGRQ